MKKIYILVAVAIIGILGWSTTVNANENIINLGTIQYSNTHEKVLTVTINSTQLIDLGYISSDIDRSALYIDNCWFSPLDNETTYIFATKQISVSWWFKNNTKSFIYQDNNTNQLYCINVDYAKIEIPPDPVIEWQNKHNISIESFDELQEVFKETLDELNKTRETLQENWLIYNQSKDEFDNNSALVITLKEELEYLDIQYNETKRLWISVTANASLYESYYKHLYEDYEDLQEEHNDLSGMYPVYLFFAIIGTGFIVTLFLKRKKILGMEKKSELEEDIDTGYSPKARKIDRFTAGLWDKIKPKDKGNPSSEPKQNLNNPLPEPKQGIEDIHKKIDGMKQAYDAFQTSTVKDMQDIQIRVDAIENKFAEKLV